MKFYVTTRLPVFKCATWYSHTLEPGAPVDAMTRRILRHTGSNIVPFEITKLIPDASRFLSFRGFTADMVDRTVAKVLPSRQAFVGHLSFLVAVSKSLSIATKQWSKQPGWPGHPLPPTCHRLAVKVYGLELTDFYENSWEYSDIKIRDFFGVKYFMKYFVKYFRNISKISRRTMGAGCIVHCNKGKYTLIMFLKVLSLYNVN